MHVQWFGGEPLLALEQIEEISFRLRQLTSRFGTVYSAEAITNGHHLSKENTKRLVDASVNRVQVTFEGSKEFHDKVRFDKKFIGSSFDLMVENVLSASELIDITARVHVAPYNLKSVRELLAYLREKGLNKAIKKIYFSPLFNYAAGVGSKRLFQVQPRKFLSSAEFAKTQTELVNLSNALDFSTGDILDVSFGLCTAMQHSSLVVSPSGLLTKCYLDIDQAGEAHASLGEVKSLKTEKVWQEYDFSVDQECRECTFAPVCLGGCPKQNMTGADKSVICTPLKFNFHDRLILQVKNADLPEDS
jgi:uncharacterized protein